MAAPIDFETLYDSQYERIFRLCRSYCGDQDEAADLAQEVFIKAWQNLDRFAGKSRPSTWLYRIAVNTCLMAQRKASLPMQPLNPQLPVSEPETQQPQIEHLYRLIGQMAETDRLIITLVLEEVPYSEIAETFGLQESTLRVRIHRIKQRLSKAFANEPA